MRDRRTVGDVLFFALECAKDDRRSFIDAWRNDTGEQCVIDALKDIAAFERLQRQLFGTTDSQLDVIIKGAQRITLPQLRKLLDQEAKANP